MTELELRQKVVNTAKAWLGAKESDGSFKPIIDLYNTINPLPVGYKVKYTDEWCATYVSAVGFKAGLKGIILPECSCSRMIALYKAKGRWQEKDSYRPSIGDIVMYDWQDGTNYATTDNTGNPDHVGIVAGINGDTITIITILEAVGIPAVDTGEVAIGIAVAYIQTDVMMEHVIPTEIVFLLHKELHAGVL